MKLSDLDIQDLFTGMIIGEAANQGFIGKLAVACVVRNRVNNQRRWDDDYKTVILQPEQFSCFNEILRDVDIPFYHKNRYFRNYWSEIWWRECWSAAFLVQYNWADDITEGSNHYHEKSIMPYWAEGETPIFKWKDHWFYKL